MVAVIFSDGSNEIVRQPYIVYMGGVPKVARTAAVDHHNRLLGMAIGNEGVAKQSLIHSYGKSFNAFAARLLPHEANLLKNMEGVVSVFPSMKKKLHTSRSWDFLGMPALGKRNHKVQSNMIVGLLDTGIYTGSPSFNDKGYGPPPPKWRGTCAKGINFTGCNNKVIGARYYRLEAHYSYDVMTPADIEGHGTHTASTAAGIPVEEANFYNLAKGTARGGVPSARIAMYKVCWIDGCHDMDILAAFDDAIDDGVDVISVSVGGGANDYFNDPIAIGAFHATSRRILTSCSGGNDGPDLMTVTNVAPWIFTVAASAMDREFKTEIVLGNGKKAKGVSVNSFSPKNGTYPLISGAKAANSSGLIDYYGYARACDYGTLDMNKVKGKIVYCVPGEGGQDTTLKELGGAGTIIQTPDEELDVAFTFIIPTATVNIKVGDMIERYINSTKNPQAIIMKSNAEKTIAPFVASFSSRGPNGISFNILKPDISAPGVDILAAWTPLTSVAGTIDDNRFTVFNIISGTSMACPHVAAAAAYVKSYHPDWSPAAIKSALMTTASEMKAKLDDTEFGYGSGQINPRKAVRPGLVYDLSKSSYIRFLCKEGYNGTILGLIVGGSHANCSSFPRALGSDGLNYPTMQFQIASPNEPVSAVFIRTVTNVGYGKSVYKATVKSAKGLKITVTPNTLIFNRPHQKKSFKVVVKGNLQADSAISSSVLQWSDSKHIVRSPIMIYYSLPME
ncbi:hypothetical protein GIB67_012936 [Kingdonia uniflora]|uniref:Cucumisin n=1 Tax=Kingdonia uniflora TaxID=39325 RepID=A0A7J7NFM2_9MAGN|nr:hypothetical protein GIB67_012936 [Kingdonia uniflora]